MEIFLSFSGGTADEIRDAVRSLIGGPAQFDDVAGHETTSVETKPEPEIVPPAKKGRGKKSAKAEDVTDIDTNGDPVEAQKEAPKPTTEPTSEGPKHDEARIAARDFNAKFGSDALIDLLKQFKNDRGEPCSGPRELFRCGHADAFLAAVKAKMDE